MKTIGEWLSLYGRDHQNPKNKLIHWICVPVIMYTVLGLLWCLPVPWRSSMPWLTGGTIFMILALLFYVRLSFSLFIGFLLVGGSMLLLNWKLYDYFGPGTYLIILIATFVVAWIFQFVGHKIEGQKPSFFEDMQFLLIGPAWILSFIYNKLGINYK